MSEDLIKRSDAIKALRCEYPTMPMFKSLREEWAIKTEGFRKAEEVIMSIPSADRPRGEWIDRGMRVPSSWVKKCSLCGHETDTWRWCNFCPNCGADMRKE